MSCRQFIASIVLVSLTAFGCQNESAPITPNDAEVPTPGDAVDSASGEPTPAPPGQTEETGPEETEPQEPVEDSGDSEVSLQILDWEGTEALVEQHRGKIVVMDLWATYCPPCLEELPNLVKLHQDHGDKVACITVSLDFQGFDDETPESYRESVMKVLQQNSATCQNVLLSTDSETVFNEKISQNSIPVVYVFNTEGQKIAEFPDPKDPGEFTYAGEILPVVEKLLERSQNPKLSSSGSPMRTRGTL